MEFLDRKKIHVFVVLYRLAGRKRKRLGTEIDRGRFSVVSAIPFSESKLVGEVVSSRKYGESLTDLEFAHLSPGSRPASRTARLRDESPCIRSLVSARDAIRCQILSERIEFCGCYRLTVASAHVLPGSRWLSVTSASVNGTTDPSPAWKQGRWRRNLSVSFDLLCIDQERSTDISESCIASDD
ncbi:hypothetical protein K0M31_016389 [Melipona bicolor]|uniref:Uncharacterized protein n=1 Tax=Melipona bicolor TaxID=60889 RepID=A0AA40KTH0_9HYME|nr:hypothetical protein K0M31_016389 [Melipona bicolor]